VNPGTPTGMGKDLRQHFTQRKTNEKEGKNKRQAHGIESDEGLGHQEKEESKNTTLQKKKGGGNKRRKKCPIKEQTTTVG